MIPNKFGRVFSLEIRLKSKEVITITPPMTISFNVTRNVSASANTGSFTITNLKETTRRKLQYDIYDESVYQSVILRAGYANKTMPVIFKGNLHQAYSSRQGTDWVTQIEAEDGGIDIKTSYSAETIAPGTTTDSVIKKLAGDMKNTAVGKISGALSGFENIKRGYVLMGPTWDLIQGLNPDGLNFIDGEKANCVELGEYIPATGVYVINSQSGLLETPRREDTNIKVKMLFEPGINVGQIVEVQSLETVNNGQYQVVGINHSGTISEAVGGQCGTTLSLWVGKKKLKEVGTGK